VGVIDGKGVAVVVSVAVGVGEATGPMTSTDPFSRIAGRDSTSDVSSKTSVRVKGLIPGFCPRKVSRIRVPSVWIGGAGSSKVTTNVAVPASLSTWFVTTKWGISAKRGPRAI